MRYIVSRDIVEEIMADLAWFSALLILFCSSPGILRQPQYLARERETFGYHVRLMVLELASLEKKKKKKGKKMTIFDFFRIRFLGLYKAEQKSEDIFVLRRVRAFHRYSFC